MTHDTNKQTQDWDELAQSIADGEAVLVLGPDAIPMLRRGPAPAHEPDEPAEMSLSQYARSKIRAAVGAGVSYFYERDNLFLFRDEDAKDNARKVLKRCLNNNSDWVPDADLLRRLVEMKFPVVLSLSPDKYLHEAFAKYAQPHQFDYFTAHHKTTDIVVMPPKSSQPLIYNLCGHAEEDRDSTILDYHDLLKLLGELLKDHDNYPPNLLKTNLRKANRYVLLGFQLDRWYLQLLLQYINNLQNQWDNKNHNFALFTKVSEDARQFIIEQFRVKCIAPSRDEFDKLYEACARHHALRVLPKPLSGIAAEVQLSLINNDFSRALEIMEAHKAALGDPHIVTMLKSQHSEWLKEASKPEQERSVDTRDLNLQKNQLRRSILTFTAHLT